MISCNELRLGNYILVNQKLQRVSRLDSKSVQSSSAFPSAENPTETKSTQAVADVQPVPLTNALLQQCGFVFHDYFKFWQLITGSGAQRSEMDIDTDYNVIDFMRKPIVKSVSSVHQLQNIYFMLKGTELNFQEAL